MEVFILALVFLQACSPLSKSSGAAPQKGLLQNRYKLDCPFHFKKLHLCAQIGPIQRPIPIGQPISFQLAFWHKDEGAFFGPYVDPGLIPIAWLWMIMPSGDHGSHPIVVTKKLDSNSQPLQGLYDVKEVSFSMPPQGPMQRWELHIQLRQNDGTSVDTAVQTIWDSHSDPSE
jgi:hypothetical protein